jgi:hypothetical protein
MLNGVCIIVSTLINTRSNKHPMDFPPPARIINRKTLIYSLQIAEKDYFLALVTQTICESYLGENFSI